MGASGASYQLLLGKLPARTRWPGGVVCVPTIRNSCVFIWTVVTSRLRLMSRSPTPRLPVCRLVIRCSQSRTWPSGSASLRRRSPGGGSMASLPSGMSSLAADGSASSPAPSSGLCVPTARGSSGAGGLASCLPRNTTRSSAGPAGWRLQEPARQMCTAGLPSGSTGASRRSATRSSGTTKSVQKTPCSRRPTASCGRRPVDGSTSTTCGVSRSSRSPAATIGPRRASIA